MELRLGLEDNYKNSKCTNHVYILIDFVKFSLSLYFMVFVCFLCDRKVFKTMYLNIQTLNHSLISGLNNCIIINGDYEE